MKTKTIDRLISLLSECVLEITDNSINERIMKIRAELETEKEHKEQKQSSQSEVYTFETTIDINSIHDDGYAKGYEAGLKQYHLLRKNQTVVSEIYNDGFKAGELKERVKHLVIKDKTNDLLDIASKCPLIMDKIDKKQCKDKLFYSGTRTEQEGKQYFLNIENGFEQTKYGHINIFCKGAFKNYLDKLNYAYNHLFEVKK